jgi:hypothetical protein
MNDVYPLEEELNLFDSGKIRFHRDAFEDLVLERGAERFAGVQILRGFPLSADDRFISVRDDEGQELGLIRDLSELDSKSRQLLEEELDRTYFVPRIRRVNHIEERFHVPRWDVETDRGPRKFEIRSGRSDVRVLDRGRVLIRDADGNHYEIPDYRRLDPASRAQVESQI